MAAGPTLERGGDVTPAAAAGAVPALERAGESVGGASGLLGLRLAARGV